MENQERPKEVDKVVKVNIEEETSNGDSCSILSDKNMEEKEKITSEESVEGRETIIEERGFFYSISTLFGECDIIDQTKAIEDDLEKSEGTTKENECLFKKLKRSKDELIIKLLRKVKRKT